MSSLSFADLAIRMATGIAGAVLLIGRGSTSTAFVRTAWLIILGLLTAALVVLMGASGDRSTLLALGGLSTVALFASVAGGCGLTWLEGVAAAITLVCGFSLLAGFPDDASSPLVLSSRGTSAVLLGTTTLAMVLGHHYLTAPTMSMVPLKRLVLAAGLALMIRALLAAIGTYGIWSVASSARLERGSPFFLAVRWGMGLFVPGIGLALTWGALRLNATQSATGILYIVVTLTLVGELSSLILSRGLGIPC